jgi:hypothetical protein
LTRHPALWLFAAIEVVEPTNHHAERVLHLGVPWRKNAFGCLSAAGCRFAERLPRVVQTLRLQNRPVLDDLDRAIVAHRNGLPAPQLLGLQRFTLVWRPENGDRHPAHVAVRGSRASSRAVSQSPFSSPVSHSTVNRCNRGRIGYEYPSI